MYATFESLTLIVNIPFNADAVTLLIFALIICCATDEASPGIRVTIYPLINITEFDVI